MSHLSSRSLLTAALSLSALCFACASDQKSSNMPDSASSPESPSDTTAPQPGDATMPAPNGQPTSTPPSEPPPQSLNQGTPSNQATPGNTVAMTNPATATAAAPQLSESQIAMVADLANSSEIEHAKLAQGKAKSASVKKFAAMMLKHHSDAKAEQTKLFKQLNLTPTQSPTAINLKQNAEKTTNALRSSTAASFDERYMDSQVEAHQQVLDTLNNELIPAASDTELVSGLNKMKATVEAHLREAKSIQAELAKNAAAQ